MFKKSTGMKERNKEEQIGKKTDLSPNMSIIMLNINGLNIPIKTEIGIMD
jgi:hypothetical protein